jgi:cytochrome c oxidase assembly factor CtaG
MTQKRLSDHILPVSSTMVGVCVTVITVIQITPNRTFASWADELMAVDGLAFMASAFLSYWSIRHPDRNDRVERYADRLFLMGLALMVFASFLVSFELFVN